MTADCTYCGSDLAPYDPVYVEETVRGQREQAGQFCNYACLTTHIDAEELTTGTCCTVDL
ncbi:hypothetical protein [Halobellus sp. GM3]|uniref:hypothetical protein n=1 Tax=Halobellus sp. GM3 TaxID=3458410 RepID=UPI00403DC528